jgi:hypothetical protein
MPALSRDTKLYGGKVTATVRAVVGGEFRLEKWQETPASWILGREIGSEIPAYSLQDCTVSQNPEQYSANRHNLENL